MAQKQTTGVEITSTSMKIWFGCSYCLRKFESADARKDHQRIRHAKFYIPTTSSRANPVNNKVKTILRREKGTEQISISISLLFHYSQCSEVSNSDASGDSHANTKQTESHLPANAKPSSFHDHQSTTGKDYTNTIQRTRARVRTFSCWQCSLECKNRYLRIDHFIRCHSASFLPNTNASSSLVHNDTVTAKEQIHTSEVFIGHLNKFSNCWECGRKFISRNDLIFHFVVTHDRSILNARHDPSGILKDRIAMAQEWMATTKGITTGTKISLNGSQYSDKLKSVADFSDHSNGEYNGSTSPSISKLSNRDGNQTAAIQKQIKIAADIPDSVDRPDTGAKSLKKVISDADPANQFNGEHVKCTLSTAGMTSSDVKSQKEMPQEHTKNTEPTTSFLHISYYCEQCQKQFTCAADHTEHFKTGHSEVTTSVAAVQDCSSDRDIMKCPKARFPTVVYLSLETFRKRICITSGKTNRCSHDACKLSTADYDFEELSLHTMNDHKDAQLKMECCNPMITYTLEEYKKHLLHTD
jgi:hypothetical protein